MYSIGAACARALAEEGANLALTYCNNKDKAEQLRNELQSIYGGSLQITLHKADLADVDEINALAKQVRLEHDQQVDILVPNAGFSKRIVDIEDVELEDFDYTHQVNVRAPYLLVKHFVPSMKQRRWGRIVFISSIVSIADDCESEYLAQGSRVAMLTPRFAPRVGCPWRRNQRMS